ncbi:tetrapyrrole biosynthesis, uroporphyrinogen III synthase [Calycina marina]|uniref:Tetrapyrrole biosynthesis, uroporphyrinogen III synthase n=1 Tax=Calycina marina TaxID=1763456 RepID=A0A9P7ZCA8_9HELO|nr:tetrapyrrole biosynthesis, uroporphyrinogen III synthase [Calycina marina]
MKSTATEALGSIPLLLLKTRSVPNDGYEEHFSLNAGSIRFKSTFVPVLEHKFFVDELKDVQNLLQQKQIGKPAACKYGGMIFTSQRAVEAFARLVEDGKGDAGWPFLGDIPIYTVGPATSRALCAIPQDPSLNIYGAEMGNGEALAHYMLDHYAEWYQDRSIKPPLLFLVGDQRRDVIPKTLMNPALGTDRRIQVDELVVYGTSVMESFEREFTEILRLTGDSVKRWVVVFSPTGSEAMLRSLGILDSETGKVQLGTRSQGSETFIATIGPTTRDYLINTFGYTPDVCAAKPSPRGVEDVIKHFMDKEH